MGTPVIKAEGLGKEYLIGAREARRETFREMLTSSFAAPFRRLRRLSGAAAPEERIWALKDVSFEVAEGEVVGIIGRNGAGKSTLLKILSRITEPSEGRALIRGRVASLLEVGTGFHPELTGRENIHLNGAILGMSRAEIERKFDEIVAFAEVETFLDTPVKRYSSGMAVRLAFAVAAHLDPEILLIDEVLAVGDFEFQRKCLGKMGSIVERQGRTILFVSHNMPAIQAICTRALVLEGGSLKGDGDVEKHVQIFLNRQSEGKVDELFPKKLDKRFVLENLYVAPTPVKSGRNCEMTIQITLNEIETINEFVVVIYTLSGLRVAVFDLRQAGIFRMRFGTCAVNIKINVSSLNLVEGIYDIGFGINSSKLVKEFTNLKKFEVVRNVEDNKIIPYSSKLLGFVDLNFDASINLL